MKSVKPLKTITADNGGDPHIPLMDRALLVCSEPCEQLEKCIAAAGYQVIKVMNGKAAVSGDRGKMFDAVVLVSTAGDLEAAETLLNLTEVRPSMPVLIVSGKGLSLQQLKTHLEAVKIFGQKSMKSELNHSSEKYPNNPEELQELRRQL